MPAADARTKLVVRHLPPNLPEAVFWQSVAPWVSEASDSGVVYRAFIPGKVRKTRDKANVSSRAYIQFATFPQVVTFHRAYDDHAFRDGRGRIYLAKVEFAPYQKAVAGPGKLDQRQGTIEEDQDFQRFIEQLDRPAEEPSPDASSTRPEQPTTTPLIEHLRAQRKSASSAGASQKRQIATKVLAKGQNAARSSASASQQSGTSGAPKAAAQSQPKSTAREPPSDKSSQPRKAKQGRPAQAPQPSNPLPSVAAPDAAATGSASAKQPKPHGRERKKGPHRRDPSSQKPPAASEASPAPANTPKAESSGSATRPEPKPTTVRRDPRRNNAAPPAPLASERTPGSSDTPAPAPTTSSRSHRAEADDSAGARRRLGNALAGIGGGQQRRRRGNAQDAASRDPGASAQPPPR